MVYGRKTTIVLIVFLLIFFIGKPCFGTEGPEFDLTARSALLMEARSGEVIYEKNSDVSHPPASMTKIMTMLLVMEAIDEGRADLKDRLVVSERAASMGGSQVYLEPGEEMTLKELMKAIAISSANDASVAVAEYIYGTENRFVSKMNERAQELGLKNTYYYNTNGLPPSDPEIEGNYTSAYDLARLTRELVKYPQIFEWTSTWMDSLRDGEFVLNNTNKLVRHYQGANGLKTGYTSEAGFCVTATAEREDLFFIAVIMGAEDSSSRFKEASKLLSYGFNVFESRLIAEQGEIIKSIDILNAEPREADLITNSRLTIPVRKGEKTTIKQRIIIDDKLKAPLSRDTIVGEVRIYRGNLLLAQSELLLAGDVEKAVWYKVLIRKIKEFFVGLFNKIF